MRNHPFLEPAAVPMAQSAFDFVSHDERIASDHAYRVIETARHKARQRSNPRHAHRRTGVVVEILGGPLHIRPLAQLNLDYHWQSDEELSETSALALEEKRLDIQVMSQDPLAFLEWLLIRNLRVLTSIGTVDDKQSILEWVWAPAIDGEALDVQVNGSVRRVPLVTARLPFSFHWICDQIGADPWQLRSNLVTELRLQLKHLSLADAHQSTRKAASIRALLDRIHSTEQT